VTESAEPGAREPAARESVVRGSAGRAPAAKPPVNWKRRILIIAIGVVLLVIGYFIAKAFLPRWWAQRIGSQVGGSFAGGIWWGLFYGVIFTLLPLVIAWQAIRRKWPVPVRIAVVVLALLVAAPNLMTLGIVLGTGSASHAAQRILDVDGPAFRGATLVGVIFAVLFAGFLLFLVESRRRRTIQLRKLQGDRRSQRPEAPPKPQ
jgi:hypothetical protein